MELKNRSKDTSQETAEIAKMQSRNIDINWKNMGQILKKVKVGTGALWIYKNMALHWSTVSWVKSGKQNG